MMATPSGAEDLRRGVLHLDLKPSNVLLAPTDAVHGIKLESSSSGMGYYEPKITDFGLAKRIGATAHSGDIRGTPRYMAPEQVEGDVRRFGPGPMCTALRDSYELLTGTAPFPPLAQEEPPLLTCERVISEAVAPPRQLQPTIPFDLEAICLKCLDKCRHRRYQTAAELADDLQRYLDNKPIVLRRIHWSERLVKLCRQNPLAASFACFLVLCLAVAGFWLRGYWHQEYVDEVARKLVKAAPELTKNRSPGSNEDPSYGDASLI